MQQSMNGQILPSRSEARTNIALSVFLSVFSCAPRWTARCQTNPNAAVRVEQLGLFLLCRWWLGCWGPGWACRRRCGLFSTGRGRKPTVQNAPILKLHLNEFSARLSVSVRVPRQGHLCAGDKILGLEALPGDYRWRSGCDRYLLRCALFVQVGDGNSRMRGIPIKLLEGPRDRFRDFLVVGGKRMMRIGRNAPQRCRSCQECNAIPLAPTPSCLPRGPGTSLSHDGFSLAISVVGRRPAAIIRREGRQIAEGPMYCGHKIVSRFVSYPPPWPASCRHAASVQI
jgi:hypothetical protein